MGNPTCPPAFLWSAFRIEDATSEGGRGPSVWDTFTATEGKIARGGSRGCRRRSLSPVPRRYCSNGGIGCRHRPRRSGGAGHPVRRPDRRATPPTGETARLRDTVRGGSAGSAGRAACSGRRRAGDRAAARPCGRSARRVCAHPGVLGVFTSREPGWDPRAGAGRGRGVATAPARGVRGHWGGGWRRCAAGSRPAPILINIATYYYRHQGFWSCSHD